MPDNYATIQCYQVRETENALLIEQDGEEHWIPKSQIKRKLTYTKGGMEIDIPTWLSEEKGLYEE